MRLLTGSLTLLAFTACFDAERTAATPWGGASDDGVSNEGPFAFAGSIWEARGLGFEEDGSAQVGMSGNTCDINPDDGSFENDLDVVMGENDVIQDVYGNVTLVLGGGQLATFIPADRGDYGGNTRPVGTGSGDVQAARLFDGGVVALRATASGCVVEWSGAFSAAMPVSGCGDLDVDRATGTAFIAHGDGASIVTPGSAIALPAGDRIAWMAEEGLVVVARSGTSDLAAFAFDGEIANPEAAWLVRLDGPLHDIAALGARGGLMVNQTGALLLVDAAGAELGRTPLRNAAGELAVNAAGDRVAVVRGAQGARVFDLRD